MATGSATFAYHSTLTASTVDVVTLSRGTVFVEVYNRAAAGGADIYVTTGSSASPTVGGNDCYIITPQSSDTLPTYRLQGSDSNVVRLISSGTPAYSVISR